MEIASLTASGALKFLVSSWAWSPTFVFALASGVTFAFSVNRWRIPWRALSAALVALLVSLAVVYLAVPMLFEETEAGIAAISAIMMRGGAVYPPPDAASRYALLYGPVTFLAHASFYLIFGKSLFSFKLLGVAALLVSLGGIYRICRTWAPPGPSLVGLGCASAVLFRYLDTSFWGRIDPLILCMVVIAIWSVLEGPTWVAFAANALAIAIVPNLKLSGGAYLLPILFLLWKRKGWRTTTLACALGAVLFALPFALPQISLVNYISALRIASGNGLNPDFLLRNVQYSAILLLPLLAAHSFAALRSRFSRDRTAYLGLIALAMLLSSVSGAKNGAGSYHLIPYVAPLLHLYFWTMAESGGSWIVQPFSWLAIPWVMTTLLFSYVQVENYKGMLLAARRGREIMAEIRHQEMTYKGRTLEIGFGQDFYNRTMEFVFIPPFDGQPYTFSASSVKDLQLSGVPLPPAALKYIESCGTDIWLIPKGEQPFAATNNYYVEYHAAFDDAFRAAFPSHYRLTDTGAWFDVWTCRH